MKITLGKIIAASMAFAGVIFLTMTAGSVYSIRQSEAAANSVAHTVEVEKQLNNVLALVVDVESGARNYVITGVEDYLASHRGAKLQIPSHMEELGRLVADNPQQQRRWAQLQPLVERKVAIASAIVEARRTQGMEAASVLVGLPEARQVTTDIRRLIADMLATEGSLLQQRREANTRQSTLSIAAAICTSAVGLGVLGIAALIIARQFRQRLNAEAGLAKKTAELQGVLDNAPLGIFLKDLNSRYLLLNAPMRHLLGAEPAACLGKTPAELFPPERAALVVDEDQSVISEARTHEIELEMKCADGVTRAFRTHKFVLRDAHGKIYALGGISEDITERRQMDARLHQALASAEAASRTKSQFLANMSHELRTPLNSIIGFSEILSDKLFGALNDKQLQYIGNILASGRHLLLLINDLLDLAKIEAGKMHIDPERVAVAALVNDAVNLVRGTAERKGVALEITKVAPALSARLDPARTKQIIYNLVSNAVKFTPAEGQITVTAKKVLAPPCPLWGGPPKAEPGEPLPGEWLHLTVMDTGIGIAPDDLERIFREFEQVDSTYARQQEGTGLGLALTSKLANLHGGGVWAESPGRVNEGSIFHVLLPLAGPLPEKERFAETLAATGAHHAAPALASTPTPFAPSAKAGPNGRPLVLVVEDEPGASDLIREYLVKGGYDVAHATTGEEALRLAAKLNPAVITLDIVLPDANGFDILARLKATRATSKIPVIVISVTDDRQMGLSLGATEFFVKPVSSDKLLAALERTRTLLRKDIQRVFVVDDEPIARESIAAMLVPRGYTVVAAESGEEALTAILAQPPDVAIIDLTMPGMSGFELVTHLRQHPATRELPICIYTAKDLSASEMHWLHEQSAAVTAKPFREQLLSELQRACANTF